MVTQSRSLVDAHLRYTNRYVQEPTRMTSFGDKVCLISSFRCFYIHPGYSMPSAADFSVLVYNYQLPYLATHRPPTCSAEPPWQSLHPRSYRPFFHRRRGPYSSCSTTSCKPSRAIHFQVCLLQQSKRTPIIYLKRCKNQYTKPCAGPPGIAANEDF